MVMNLPTSNDKVGYLHYFNPPAAFERIHFLWIKGGKKEFEMSITSNPGFSRFINLMFVTSKNYLTI
jgi:hypothetical protein